MNRPVAGTGGNHPAIALHWILFLAIPLSCGRENAVFLLFFTSSSVYLPPHFWNQGKVTVPPFCQPEALAPVGGLDRLE